MSRMTQQQYNQAVNLMSHLILTKPQVVIALLQKHGEVFTTAPNRQQLIDGVLEALKEGSPTFQNDLEAVINVHIQKKGKEMLALEKGNDSYVDVEEEDAFFGSLAKIAIGGVAKLISKRKKRGNRGGSSSSRSSGRSSAAAVAAANARARAQQANLRRDMQRKMREQQAQQRRREEQLRAEMRRQSERQQRENEMKIAKINEDNRKKNRKVMTAGGIGVGLLVLVGIGMMMNKKPAPTMPMPYTMQPQLQPSMMPVP